ncbi:LCP family protein, partial [candidate division FCPU426 bacterium]|nr:LCP family protein [candidate division FCPU426 bacterium]
RYRSRRVNVHNTAGPGADDFMAAGNIPAWRSLLRFLVLGLMVVGAIYLSAISMNILILGTDDVDYSKHTDTIMILHWRPLPRRLAMLSIPRDTLIQMPKRGPMKINAVYAYGHALGSREYGLAMTRASLETLLGIKINYVVHLRYSNFIKLIDALGGVPIYVEKRMRYTDQAGGVNIDMEPGYQLLDGRQALNYVRFRHDRDGDIGRIRRQQKFTKAFISQLAQFSKLHRTAAAFYTFINQMETNLGLPAAMFLAVEIKGVARGSWRQAILPGKGVYIDGKSYWKPDFQGIRRVIDSLGKPPRVTNKAKAPARAGTRPAGENGRPESVRTPAPKEKEDAGKVSLQPTPKPTPRQEVARRPLGRQPAVRVLNGCGVPGVAGRVTQRLLGNNIHIRSEDTTNAPSFNFAQTIIKSKAANLAWARNIASVLNLGEERIQIIPENINYPTITIVIGGDYQELIK